MERFWSKVDKTDSCWLWTASKNQGGYGHFAVKRKPKMAHRIAYEMCVGPIPEGFQIDHLCRVRNCVNPEHLEPVTAKTNMERAAPFMPKHVASVNGQKSHCPQGHAYSGANLYVQPDGRRACRECKRVSRRARFARTGK